MQIAGNMTALVPKNGRMTALLTKLSGKAPTGLELEGGSSRSGDMPSSISSDFTIAGNIICKGKARFDGELNGDIECNQLIVGSNGRVIGDIKADSVIVYGSVQGAIRCASIILKSGAHVVGDIFHDGIAIEMGASFSGRSDRLPGAVEIAPRPTANASTMLPTQAR